MVDEVVSASEQTGPALPPDLSFLPEQFRADESFKGLTSLEDLSKGYKDLKARYSEAPTDVSGYDFSYEDVEPSLMDGFKKDALASGLSKKAAELISKNYVERATALHKAEVERVTKIQEQELETLKTEFGDSWRQVSEEAAATLKAIGGDSLLSLIEGSGLGTNPTLFKAIVNVSKLMKEGKLPDNVGTSLETSESVQEEITRLRNDPEFERAYRNTSHPKHKESQKRMTDLYSKRLELTTKGK